MVLAIPPAIASWIVTMVQTAAGSIVLANISLGKVTREIIPASHTAPVMAICSSEIQDELYSTGLDQSVFLYRSRSDTMLVVSHCSRAFCRSVLYLLH